MSIVVMPVAVMSVATMSVVVSYIVIIYGTMTTIAVIATMTKATMSEATITKATMIVIYDIIAALSVAMTYLAHFLSPLSLLTTVKLSESNILTAIRVAIKSIAFI